MKAGDRVYVSIRPQDIEVVSESAEVGGMPAMRGKVSRIVHMGSHVEYCIDAGEIQLNCHCVHDLGSSLGTATGKAMRCSLEASEGRCMFWCEPIKLLDCEQEQPERSYLWSLDFGKYRASYNGEAPAKAFIFMKKIYLQIRS